MGSYLNPGNFSFRGSLRSKIYVDKSKLIARTNEALCTEQKYICVSRPRRFGKSMAANMLAAYYDRSEHTDELFENLKISKDQSYRENLNRYDVIKINIQEFLSMTGTVEEMLEMLKNYLISDFKEAYPKIHLRDEKNLIQVMKDVFSYTKCPFVILIDEWDCLFREYKQDKEAQKKYLVQHPYQAQQTGYIQPYADCPLDGIQVGEDVYISIVNKADRYCWFMTPYLIITDEMTHALSLAARRGVDVRIITPGIPDKKLIYSITRSFYHNLVQDGVRIYEWTPGFCHAKMSVADDCMATCGTINLDYRSLYHHFENGCFMADCDAVLDIRRDMEQTFKQCREVTEKYKSGRSATLRLGQLFLRLFAELL